MNIKYSPEIQKEIENAIVFMVKQFLKCYKSGKPVILHSIRVGTKLMQMNQSKDMVITGFLHDLIEDSNTNIKQIKKQFGADVAKLTKALTFSDKIKDYKERWKNEIKKIIETGREAMIIKVVDASDSLPYYTLIKNPKIKEEVLWKQQLIIDSFEKYLKNKKIFQEYKKMYSKIKPANK